MPGIDDFKSTIGKRTGLAKPNRFAVFFSLPIININPMSILTNIISGNRNPMQLINDPRDATFLCESCTMPGKQINTTDYITNLRAVKKPYGYINEDVTFTYILTGDYFMKNIFTQWQEQIYNTNQTLNYKKDYTSTVNIQQLNDKNVPIYTVQLRNAYPTTVNAIELNSGAENTAARITVTMAYDDWEEANFTGAMLGVGERLLGKIF